MKQTKLVSVIKWLNKQYLFKRSDFVKKFGEQCAETTYLCYIMNAGYVDRYARGKYILVKTIPTTKSEPQLRTEAYGTKKKPSKNNDVLPFAASDFSGR